MGEKLSQMEEVYNHDFRVAFSYLNQYGPVHTDPVKLGSMVKVFCILPTKLQV